ncbi:hypothetical protein [Dactylosporangium sp. NPDC006015]|uniref:hypothetical protein n=1 Tax=Dactylosporangium sp. NPDC006015 TaxID=3154576 RepID=UPI0033B40E6A
MNHADLALHIGTLVPAGWGSWKLLIGEEVHAEHVVRVPNPPMTVPVGRRETLA